MKNLLILVLVLCIGCGPKEKPLDTDKFRINAKIKGLKDGKIFVTNNSNSFDIIEVKGGSFILERAMKDKVLPLAFYKDTIDRRIDAKTRLFVLLEPSIMNLEIDYSDFSSGTLTGSKSQDDQYKLDGILEEIAVPYNNEIAAFELVRKKYSDARAAGASKEELEVIKYEDDECRNKLEPMWEKQGEATVDFIKSHPKSFISAQSLLFQLNGMTYKEAKSIYDKLDPDHLKIGIISRLEQSIEAMKKGIPGALAGNFNTEDINGEQISLADFKGQYLLIDFWASWCVPCRKGNPHLLKQYAKYKAKGLEILGVSDDDRDHDAWREAVDKDKIGVWRHVLRGLKLVDGKLDFNDRSTDINEGYNISTLPTKILVGPDGIIIGRYGDGGGSDEDMDRDLAALFD